MTNIAIKQTMLFMQTVSGGEIWRFTLHANMNRTFQDFNIDLFSCIYMTKSGKSFSPLCFYSNQHTSLTLGSAYHPIQNKNSIATTKHFGLF